MDIVEATTRSRDQSFELARGLMRQQRWVEAALLWQTFREQYGDHRAPWLEGALSLMHQRQFTAAAELLAHARAHFYQHVATWLTCAEWARLQGDPTLESAYLSQGRERMGDHWQLLQRAADLASRCGDHAQGLSLNALARQHTCERSELVQQAAQLAEKQSDWPQALRHWQRVLALKPQERSGYLKVANAYKMLGDVANARRYRLASQYGAEMLEAALPPPGSIPPARGVRSQRRYYDFLVLVLTKAALNLKSEAARTYLNRVWVVIEPLLHLVIYYFLFGRLLHTGIDNYGLFLLSGLVPWMWFTKAVSSSASSILGGQSLMLNSNVVPEFFPLVSVAQATLKQLPALLLLLMLGMATDPQTLSWALLYLPLIIGVQLVLTVVVSMLLAAAVSRVRDLANLVGTGLTLLMFVSGVIYQHQSLPGTLGYWVSFNPLTLLISAYREIILHGRAPGGADMAYVVALTLTGGVLVLLVYRHQRRHFVRRGMS